jgi:CheY-like chemotaxis protein
VRSKRTRKLHVIVEPGLGLVTMSPSRLSNLTIVVVEDHDDARRFLGLFLNQMGANVVVARNAFEGLEAIKNNHPNLVVSDIRMPGMDGFGLLREIRALGPDAGGSVPVIAMTAHITHADRARILNAGFQAYLPKPFTPDKLVETILTMLKD